MSRLINPHLHSPAECSDLLDEYNSYMADGPPYDGPNGKLLLRRDNHTRRPLLRRWLDSMKPESENPETKNPDKRGA